MKSSTADLLPEELLWADGGHASDVVLTAIADGEAAIVPTVVRLHVDRCPACTTHLGHAALLSLHAGAELASGRADDRTRSAAGRQPLPWRAIALGLAVAVLGLVPSSLDDAARARAFVAHELPLLLHGLGTLARRLDEPGSASGLFFTYSAAAMLVVVGVAAVRLLPKKEAPR
jgi:hypothetical protein